MTVAEWLTTHYSSIQPRTCELSSVILLSAGINVLTSAAAERIPVNLGIAGVMMTTAGALMFAAAGHLHELYDSAQRLSTRPGYESKALREIASGIGIARLQTRGQMDRAVLLFGMALVSGVTGGILIARGAVQAWAPSLLS